MSKKIGRKSKRWSYSFKKAIMKLALFQPSKILVATGIMGISIFLLGGGIYDILMEPLTILPVGGRFLSFIPRRIHEQLLIGSIGVMIFYTIGALGLLLIYNSTKYIRNQNQISILTKVGATLIIIAFVAVESVLFWILNYQ
jgi:hypothetical protein